jgi:hypothetical protein
MDDPPGRAMYSGGLKARQPIRQAQQRDEVDVPHELLVGAERRDDLNGMLRPVRIERWTIVLDGRG